MRVPDAALRLACEHDVERRDGRFFATGREPWLSVPGLDLAPLVGRFVELTYRSSLWDEPVRPVLRLHRAGCASPIDHICAGPVAGAAFWTGRIPNDATRMSLSPTCRPGPFDFVVERVRRRRWPALLAEGLGRNPKSTRSAVLTRLIGWAPESDNNLAWAIGATPPAGFENWWRRRWRAPDLDGLERPRFDWREAPEVVVIVSAGADDRMARTCASLVAQVFRGWRARLVDAGVAPADPRIAAAPSIEAALAGCGDGALVATIAAGDILPPAALATLIEQAHRHPDARVFYGDAVVTAPARRADFLPGWSPRLQAARPYLRAPVFVRGPRALAPAERASLALPGALPPALVARLAPDEVVALRRIMVEHAASPAVFPAAATAITPRQAASVIIPTKDHPALLRRAIESIRSRSGSDVEIVVVDNASVTEEARELLASLRGAPDARVLDYTGAFNFSAICNAGAAAARGAILVFLNDDTQVLSDDWLDRLCAHAADPAIGAVGAKLTYPDGRLQHVGVLLGMGGSAGHFGAPAPGDDPGWAGRHLAVHEVSAVTGACLAVAREKFEAVGGFDAVDLPIELSDIDLCLKLAARGWQTIVDPAVHLLHEESASRGGATLRRLAVHDKERAIFLERWRHILRDDPAFHPGLSLYSWREALG